MDLLEYQAKELFREMGIPVLPSQRIDNSRDLKGLQIPYPVVLKSQVRAGGRGRAGGIRFAENTIDAIAAARTIFNLPILGEYPQVLLAEAKYDATREFYLAVTLDYDLRRPVLLGSSQGGMNLEAVMELLQQVVVDQEFSSFYARHLTLKMGLQGSLIQSVSTVIEKMYHLFIQNDLDGVEINPLGVSPTGELMALDGKITVNDAALRRHPALASLAAKMPQSDIAKETPTDIDPGKFLPIQNWLNRDGNIGILCNGTSLAMAMVDLVYSAGGKPRLCLIVGEETSGNLTPASWREQLEQALERLTQNKNIKVLLVNILGNTAASQEVVAVIDSYLQRKVNEMTEHPQRMTRRVSTPSPKDSRTRIGDRRPEFLTLLPQFVVRLAGGELDKSQEPLATMPVHWSDNLDDAVEQAISLAKAAAKSRSGTPSTKS
ncbi:acetate--CoA ligase family protein [Trichocoleus sp. DQ-A3]|uniref:ATP-grasp domain-containing protein n=1 Tax=Cyanophyceae TaxID=3028117 RepID=UPI001688467C|nr:MULTISPECIES: ATP-grasp domain-containing protein [unclassified Coleofasciculus]MBD1839727.1 acetate--CoA ligase family protein [Coleofasciculus sp. FACHB-501]MBD1902123.1 acetate--CoA ligase family protein [Coleofasciculus sp. FACHB-125]